MSGTNPFRRNDQSTYPRPEGNERKIVPAIHTDVAQKARTKTSKTVRIVSPHSPSSPSEPQGTDDSDIASQSQAARLQSPPPSSYALHDATKRDTTLNPFAVSANETTQPASITPLGVQQSDLDWSKGTVNPFKGSAFREAGSKTQDAIPGPQPTQRTLVDVDGFKTLLLMGQDSSSSTAQPMPSVSFGPKSGSKGFKSNPNADSANEEQLSSSDESHEYEKAESEKARPTVPKHHHGEPDRAKGPRVVSFEDPALTFSDVAEKYEDGIENTSKIRPMGNHLDPHAFTKVSASQNIESGAKVEGSISDKKVPPAPPPSRRHGQNRPLSYIADTSSSSSIIEERQRNSEHRDTPVHTSSNKPAPPPPRRSGPMRSDSRSSIPSLVSKGSSPSSTLSKTNAVQGSPIGSPSFTSEKRYSAIAPNPSSPPPPPPRRRGSSQSSHNPSRFSGEYRNVIAQRARGDSSASSISQLQIPPALETSARNHGQDRQDPLADLSTLQREVDEYRERMGK